MFNEGIFVWYFYKKNEKERYWKNCRIVTQDQIKWSTILYLFIPQNRRFYSCHIQTILGRNEKHQNVKEFLFRHGWKLQRRPMSNVEEWMKKEEALNYAGGWKTIFVCQNPDFNNDEWTENKIKLYYINLFIKFKHYIYIYWKKKSISNRYSSPTMYFLIWEPTAFFLSLRNELNAEGDEFCILMEENQI